MVQVEIEEIRSQSGVPHNEAEAFVIEFSLPGYSETFETTPVPAEEYDREAAVSAIEEKTSDLVGENAEITVQFPKRNSRWRHDQSGRRDILKYGASLTLAAIFAGGGWWFLTSDNNSGAATVSTQTTSRTRTATASARPTVRDSPTPTRTDSPTPTRTDSPTATSTDSPTPTETDSPTPTKTASPTPTETANSTRSQTATPTPTSTSDRVDGFESGAYDDGDPLTWGVESPGAYTRVQNTVAKNGTYALEIKSGSDSHGVMYHEASGREIDDNDNFGAWLRTNGRVIFSISTQSSGKNHATEVRVSTFNDNLRFITRDANGGIVASSRLGAASPDTWYRFEFEVHPSNQTTGSVYDSSMNLIGRETLPTIGESNLEYTVLHVPRPNGQQVRGWFDDVMIP